VADMATNTTPARGYTATKDQLLKRLRRIEGQVRGIEGMVEDDPLLHRRRHADLGPFRPRSTRWRSAWSTTTRATA